MVADQPEPGAKLIVRHPEERFPWRHARVTWRLKLASALNMEKKLPDGDADGEPHNEQLLVAERVAAARPGGAIRMGYVIKWIIACDNRKQPISPFARMSEPPTPQSAGPRWLNAYLLKFRRRIDSSDEDEPVRPVWPPRCQHLKLEDGDYEQESDPEPEPPRGRKKARRRTNPFISAEAGVEGDASGDEEIKDKNNDLNIV